MEATMNIPNLRTRGKTYWWRHRVPEHLKPAFRNNGHNPNQELNYSLKTKDLATAIARQKIAEAWMQNGGVGMLDFINPREHYLVQLERHTNAPDVIQTTYDAASVLESPFSRANWVKTGEENTGNDSFLLRETRAALSLGDMNESDLTQEQLAAYVVESGDSIPDRYKYSLRDALADHRVRKEG